MRKQNDNRKRASVKYLLSLLMLVCVIALCFSVGRTYAVITEATNVVVNTFYGESETESDEPETDEPETDEPETDEPESDEPETDEPESDEPDTEEPGTEETETPETGTTETETETSETETGTSETETSETDTGEGAKTGDESNILIWIIIAAAALAGILAIGMKMLKDKKRTD